MMLTADEKDKIAQREITITLSLGEAGAVGVAIGQMMRRIEEGKFDPLVPMDEMKIYLLSHGFATRMTKLVEDIMTDHEKGDLREFQEKAKAMLDARRHREDGGTEQ